jgi:hypothetical protein
MFYPDSTDNFTDIDTSKFKFFVELHPTHPAVLGHGFVKQHKRFLFSFHYERIHGRAIKVRRLITLEEMYSFLLCTTREEMNEILAAFESTPAETPKKKPNTRLSSPYSRHEKACETRKRHSFRAHGARSARCSTWHAARYVTESVKYLKQGRKPISRTSPTRREKVHGRSKNF